LLLAETTSTLGRLVTRATGAKSWMEYESSGEISVLVIRPGGDSSTVAPSLAERATAVAPIAPLAPARFSTMTDRLSDCPSCSARIRAITSV